MKRVIEFVGKHKLTIAILVVVFVIASLILPSRIKLIIAGPTEQYETTKVKKEDLRQIISASGRVQAENQVDLKFQTSGLLTWVGVKEGDYVKKWQAIASLDKRELEKNLLKELRDYSKERWDFEEDIKVTYKDRIITDTIKRILEKNQFDLDQAVADVEIKDIALKLATLITPIEGIVTHIDTPVAGVNITPATAIFTIADPAKIKFVANIDEADISKVKLKQRAIITLDAYPEQKFEGEINKIAFSSVTTKGGGTAYPVEIFLPENIDQRFKVGMNGDIEIIVTEEKEILTVPTQAIKEKGGKKFVRLIEGRNITQVEVETGFEGETKTEVTKGIKEGQTVILREKK